MSGVAPVGVPVPSWVYNGPAQGQARKMRGPLPGSLCGGGGQRWDAAAGREKERADGGNYEARLATREDLDAPMAPRSLNQGSLEPYLETTCSRTGGKPPVPHSARLEGRLSLEPKWLEPKWLEPKWLRTQNLPIRPEFDRLRKAR